MCVWRGEGAESRGGPWPGRQPPRWEGSASMCKGCACRRRMRSIDVPAVGAMHCSHVSLTRPAALFPLADPAGAPAAPSPYHAHPYGDSPPHPHP